MKHQKMIVNIDLLKKYDKAGPRYTSYPTAPYFHDGVGPQTYLDHLKKDGLANPQQDISLYFHLPFCDTLCYFCGCNMMVTRNQQKIEEYIEYLDKEMALLQPHLNPHRKIKQLHWGGGTPTHLSPDQIRRLGEAIHKWFPFDANAEVSVELDPRELTREHMVALKEIGFNRCSMGVQDFDEKVQKAVNRLQPESVTVQTLHWARELGFMSINLDLMYGLPFQKADSYEQTIDRILALNPDRLAVFNYAHLPQLIKHQQLIKDEWLPSPEEKLQLLKLSIEKLTGAGMVYIGMDHFAQPQDELTIALENGSLYRNFQGYSTHAGLNLLAIGITGIGMLSDLYIQNFKDLETYYQAIDNDKLPIKHGVKLNTDDQLRREIITELMCNFSLQKKTFEQKYNIQFDHYFAQALKNLESFEADNLIRLNDETLDITEEGRLLIRNIVMNFDAYLQKKEAGQPQFSRTV
jgi:oxygen-independent coproporphyrinogen III oxidase